MSGENPQDSFSTDRAELFEALGHPTRIKILELLAKSSMGFSDLKKALNIESSGQLQFHLGKLQGLVKTVEGNYTLTDEGKEALRIMAAKEPVKIEPKTRYSITPLQVITIVLAIALVFTVAFGFYNNQLQNQNFNNLNQSYVDSMQQYNILNRSMVDLAQNYGNLNQSYIILNRQYNSLIQLLNNSSLLLPTIVNYSIDPLISPPISERQAIVSALIYSGWNFSSQVGTIDVAFMRVGFQNASAIYYIDSLDLPISNYSPVLIGNITYRYVWVVHIESPQNNSGFILVSFGPPAYYVDAATREVFNSVWMSGAFLIVHPPITVLQQGNLSNIETADVTLSTAPTGPLDGIALPDVLISISGHLNSTLVTVPIRIEIIQGGNVTDTISDNITTDTSGGFSYSFELTPFFLMIGQSSVFNVTINETYSTFQQYFSINWINSPP